MLAEPQWPAYANRQAEWKAATRAGFATLPEPIPGACKRELWHYSPALLRDSETVDPLSLALSLRENQDERVRLRWTNSRGSFRGRRRRPATGGNF